MKSRWPLKHTVPIQWSAPTWRPTINFGVTKEPERPDAIRIVRPPQARIYVYEFGSGI
jgi:hypothetical protein